MIEQAILPWVTAAGGAYAGRTLMRGSPHLLLQGTVAGGLTGHQAYSRAADNPFGFSWPTAGAITGLGAGMIQGLRTTDTKFYESLPNTTRSNIDHLRQRGTLSTMGDIVAGNRTAAGREVSRVLEEVYGSIRGSNVQKFMKPMLTTTLKGGAAGLAMGTAIWGLGQIGSSMRKSRHTDNMMILPGYPA